MGQSTEELSQQIAGTRENLANDLDALGNRVSPHAIIERRKSAARDRLHRAKGRIMGTAGDVQQTVSSSADTVASTAQDVKETAQEKYEGSPLAAGLVAFGTGMVISALIPPSSAETRVAQQVVDVARDQGQPALDGVRSSAEEIAANLKESAAEATQQVKDAASESAGHVKDEGLGAGDEVSSEAQRPRDNAEGWSSGT